MKKKIKIEDLKFDLGNCLNAKATIEYEIDKEQKFLAATHLELGAMQKLFFQDRIKQLQQDHSYTLKRIAKLKQQIIDYEQKGIR